MTDGNTTNQASQSTDNTINSPSLEDTIRASVSEVTEGASNDSEPSSSSVPSDSGGAENSATETISQAASDRPRDERGRFTTADSPADPAAGTTTEADIKAARDEVARRARPTTAKASPAQASQEDTSQPGKARTRPEAVQELPGQQQQQPKRLSPPERWPVESKEEFHKLPPVAQKEVLSFWNGIESHTTKLWQDLNREVDQNREVNEIVAHYLPGWNVKGITKAQAIAELCAAQDYLIKSPIEGVARIMQKTGVTLEQLEDFASGGGARASQSQQGQVSSQLTADEVRRIIQESLQQQTAHGELESARAEVVAVRDELDSEGRYKYPELHDASYIERVKPLVEDIRRTQPGISWAEATKKGVNTLRILEGRAPSINGSPSPSNPRLSRENEIASVRAASVSVRGRGGAAPKIAVAKPGESIEESLRTTIASLSQNSH